MYSHFRMISLYCNDYKNERSGVTSVLTLQAFLFCKIKRQSVFQRQRDINSNNISVHLWNDYTLWLQTLQAIVYYPTCIYLLADQSLIVSSYINKQQRKQEQVSFCNRVSIILSCIWNNYYWNKYITPSITKFF